MFPPLDKGEQITIESYLSAADEGPYVAGFLKELELVTKKGGFVPVEIRAFEIHSEDQVLYAAILRDVVKDEG